MGNLATMARTCSPDTKTRQDGVVIRLIATDLDGTIVPHDGSVSARTLAALDAAADSGIRIVFVTGRPPRWMQDIVSDTGHRGVAICANGAYVYDMAADSVVETFAMSVDDARDCCEVDSRGLAECGIRSRDPRRLRT